jgi:transcriptional regulator with XRE-family HTH domain
VSTPLSKNIKRLRQAKKLTQSALADVFDVQRTTVSAWEEGRADPRAALLPKIADFFGVSLDELFFGKSTQRTSGVSSVNVLPIAVDRISGKELITVVPVKAAAGYLNGFGDLDFISSLPTFSMPIGELPQDMSLRMFQIEGDSMLPIRSGSYILASFVENHRSVNGRQPHIVVTRNDGIVFKRVDNQLNETGCFRLLSDNTDFPPFDIPATDALELWRARAHVSFNFDPLMPVRTIERQFAEDITATLQRIEARLK